MTAILTTTDLHVMNGEPRVMDLRLADALGFTQARNIRNLITRNIDELRRHGEIVATMTNLVAASEGNSLHGEANSPDDDDDPKPPHSGAVSQRRRGAPSTDYWLNEPQALLICMFARTDKAADGREEIIRVFLAWRRGELVQVRERQGQVVAEDVRALPIMERVSLATEFRRVFGPQQAQAMWPFLDLPMPPVIAIEPPDDALTCLRVLLESGANTKQGLPPAIGDAIEAALEGDEAMRALLLASGIRVTDGGREGIFVASSHPFLMSLFETTPWEDREFIPTLAGLPGAHRAKPMKFGAQRSHRTVFIPAEAMDAARAFRSPV